MQYTVYRLAFPSGPLLLRAPWQRRGSSRVSTLGTSRVAGQSLDGGHYRGICVCVCVFVGKGIDMETDMVKAEMPADDSGK